MGYQIAYERIGNVPPPRKKRHPGKIAAILVLILVFGAIAVKSAGLDWVKEFLIPGDPDITAAALENMVESLHSGDGLVDAIRTFCQEIVDNAQSQ